MGMLTSWMYPLKGIVFITTSPALLLVILKFGAVAVAASLLTITACFHFFYSWHLGVLAKVFGVHLFSKLLASLTVLVESGLPVYFILNHRFNKLQEQLFDTTLQLKGVAVQQLQGPDEQVLQSMVTHTHKLQRQASQHRSMPASIAMAALTFAFRLLIKPRPKEAAPMRKLRDLITLLTSMFLPFLLPLFAYRDSYAEAAALLSRYWDLKGVTDPDAQEIVAEQKLMGAYRSFGLTAALLNTIPVLNWFLGLTNTVGAALFAAEQEQRRQALFKRQQYAELQKQRQ